MKGGCESLPAHHEVAIANARCKVMIWEKAIELAGQDSDPHTLVPVACDRVLQDRGVYWVSPPAIGLETEWGANKTEAEAIVQEHRDFLNASSEAQLEILGLITPLRLR